MAEDVKKKDEETELTAEEKAEQSAFNHFASESIFGSTFGTGSTTDKIFNKNMIFGQPLSFNAVADIGGKKYMEKILSDMPVISILPGVPDFTPNIGDIHSAFGGGESEAQKEIDNEENEVKEKFSQTYTAFVQGAAGLDEKVAEFYQKTDTFKRKKATDMLMRGALSSDSGRIYELKPAMAEYMRYLRTLLSSTAIKMGIEYANIFGSRDLSEYGKYNNLEEFTTSANASCLNFYVTRDSSVTDSASNSFGASNVLSQINAISAQAKELNFLLGTGDRVLDSGGSTGKTASKIRDSSIVKDTAGKIVEMAFKGASGLGAEGLLTSTLFGYNMQFPEIWQDSTYDRSYNISVQLRSPYGDRESIFKFVYTPFLALMALSLPRQHKHLSAYNAPFILKVDCPGCFSCSMGAITSFTYKKSEEYSADGYPLGITINLSIKDLYPTLMMSEHIPYLEKNRGMADFINNFAGIPLDRLNYRENFDDYIKMKINSGVNRTIYNLNDRVNEKVNNLKRKLNFFVDKY